MTTIEIIREDFAEFIRVDPSVPEELRNSLRLTERVPKFVDNLAEQIHQIEARGIKLDRAKLKMMVYSLSGMFVHMLKTKANQMQMSEIAKSALKKDLEGDELTQKLDDQGNGDLTEELGIIITDKVVSNGGRTTN